MLALAERCDPNEFWHSIEELLSAYLGRTIRYDEIKWDNPPKTAPQTIGKRELAMEIFPHISPDSAVNSLRRLLKSSPALQSALARAGHKPNSRVLTQRQADLVRQFVGDPKLSQRH